MRCFVGLGSNLGDREARLRAGVAALAATPGVEVVGVSRIFETTPEGGRDEPAYLNAAIALETRLPARALLERLLEIERAEGRMRGEGGMPRTLDLDLLLFGDTVIEEPGLVVPHPRLAGRAFVLEPLAELAGALRHPALPASIAELAARVRDPEAVRPYAPAAPWP